MKQPIKIVIVMVMHYFHSVLEHGLNPSLNLNHNTYSAFPLIQWGVKAWHAAQRNILTLPELSECTIPQYIIQPRILGTELLLVPHARFHLWFGTPKIRRDKTSLKRCWKIVPIESHPIQWWNWGLGYTNQYVFKSLRFQIDPLWIAY